MAPERKKSDNRVSMLVALGSLGMAAIVTFLLPIENVFLKMAAGVFIWLVLMSFFSYTDSKQ